MTQQPFKHLALIPDGNRRWAKQHGIGSEKKVYEQGAETTFEVIKTAFEANIPYVTFWASSYANLLGRPKLFVDGIEAIFARKFHELASHPLIHDNKVKVSVLGEWRSILKPKTIEAMEESMSATAHYSDRNLTVLIGYDGVRERGAAVAHMLENAAKIQVAASNDLEANAELLRSYSWTGHLPDVDLVVRSGSWNDPHNSASFLSLISGDSQYAFPKVLWPDLTADMLQRIIADFVQRERRLGR